jgi:hypothetical protein
MRILVLALPFVVGCVAPAGDESFIIRENLATDVGGECTFTASVNSAALARGQLLLDSPIPYFFHPLLESRIVAGEGRESLRTIFLNGADIELEIGPIETIAADGTLTVDPDVEVLQFRSLFSAPLPPNGGLTSAQFDLVPLAALDTIRGRVGDTGDTVHAQVTATATAFGDYYGDQIESAPFQFPVTVCNDCVIGNNSAAGVPACDTIPQGAVLRQGNPCNPFQDGVVDCCSDGGAIRCPAIGTMPTE